jgi:hypothetical protein
MKKQTKKTVTTQENNVSNEVSLPNDTTGSVDLNIKGDTSKEVLAVNGIGDVIENITSVLGIEKCTECEERRKKFNKSNIFPWMKSEIREVTDTERELMQRVNASHMIQNNDVVALFALYNSLFDSNTKRCNCPGLIRRMIGRINDVIN